MSEKIYLANHTEQDIYVICGLKPEWDIANFFEKLTLTGIMGVLAEFTIPVGIVLSVHNVDGTVKSLNQYCTATRLAGSILQDETLGSRAQAKAQEFINQFKSNSLSIGAQTYKDIKETGGLSYIDVSTLAGLFGSDTVYMIVLADGGKKVASVVTNQDDSWIANENGLVRSKFGTINQEDPSAGNVPWEEPYSSSFIPKGNYLESIKGINITLTCNALDTSQKPKAASYDLTLKSSIGLENINGVLKYSQQAQQNGFKPGGSWIESCNDIKITLKCQAQKIDQSWVEATFDLTNSPEDVLLTNQNGVLQTYTN